MGGSLKFARERKGAGIFEGAVKFNVPTEGKFFFFFWRI